MWRDDDPLMFDIYFRLHLNSCHNVFISNDTHKTMIYVCFKYKCTNLHLFTKVTKKFLFSYLVILGYIYIRTIMPLLQMLPEKEYSVVKAFIVHDFIN